MFRRTISVKVCLLRFHVQSASLLRSEVWVSRVDLNMLMFGQLSYQKNSRFKTSLTWKGTQSVWGRTRSGWGRTRSSSVEVGANSSWGETGINREGNGWLANPLLEKQKKIQKNCKYRRIEIVTAPLHSDLAFKRGRYFRVAVILKKTICTVR